MQTGEDECEFGGKEAFKVKGGVNCERSLRSTWIPKFENYFIN